MINKNIVLLICAALLVMAMPMVSAEDAPSMYFVPDGGSGVCGEVMQVDLMLNHSVVVTGVQAQINFDNSCVNITNVNYAGCPWQRITAPGWGHYYDNIRLASQNLSGVPPGVHKIATIDVECIGDVNCTSDIEITDTMPNGYTIYNTTFTCNTTEDPDVAEISIGDGVGTVTIPILVTNATNVGSCDITLTYDASIVNVIGVTGSDMEYMEANTANAGSGYIRIGACQGEASVSDDQFSLASISFEPVATVGTSALTLTVNTLKDATPDCVPIAYVIWNGVYETLLNGDTDDDGDVDVQDAVYIIKYVIGVPGYDTIDEDAADVNGDGIIDISDATYLLKHLAGVPGFEELR